jgi:hypothetical protein
MSAHGPNPVRQRAPAPRPGQIVLKPRTAIRRRFGTPRASLAKVICGLKIRDVISDNVRSCLQKKGRVISGRADDPHRRIQFEPAPCTMTISTMSLRAGNSVAA